LVAGANAWSPLACEALFGAALCSCDDAQSFFVLSELPALRGELWLCGAGVCETRVECVLFGPSEFDSTWYFSVLAVDFVPTGYFLHYLPELSTSRAGVHASSARAMCYAHLCVFSFGSSLLVLCSCVAVSGVG